MINTKFKKLKPPLKIQLNLFLSEIIPFGDSGQIVEFSALS